jgi:hypothetical protein
VTFGSSGSEPRRGHLFYTIIGIMPKVKKPKPRKRGPKEERLVIQEDPEQALARLLKPTNAPKPKRSK